MSQIAAPRSHEPDGPAELPACLTRDNLTSPYFPSTSLPALAAIALLAAVFVLTSLHRLNHTDLWGHVNFGRWMAEHAALPAVEPFSADPASAPVLHSAWLAQRTAYEVHRWFGHEGLVFGHALLVTLTAAALMLAVVRRGAPPIWAWTAGAAMFVLALPIVGTIRPQLFGQLGAALVLLACAELPQRRHPLVWLPLVAALWANLHGSVVIGMAILVVYAAGATFDAWRSHGFRPAALLGDRSLYLLWAAPLLVTAAACFNPHGPLLLVRVLLFNDHAALGSISEWRATSPLSLTGGLMIVSVGLTALLAWRSPRKWQVHEVLLLLVFGLATLPAMRMLVWWALVWPWVCIPHAAAVVRSFRERSRAAGGVTHIDFVSRSETTTQPTAMRTVIAMGVVFMAILVAPPTFSIVAGYGRGEGTILGHDTPIYVADEAVRRELAGTIAAPLDWADFLVWKSEGRLRPLVYSHVHLADPAAWDAYQTILSGDEKWLETLQARNMQYVVASRSRSAQLARQILLEDRSGRGRLRILYQDQRCVLAELAL